MHYIARLLEEAGILSEKDAREIGILAATYYRIKNGRGNKYLIEALKMRAGYLKGWEGVKIRNGFLITPDGETIHKNQILSMQYGENLAYLRGYEAGKKETHQFTLAI